MNQSKQEKQQASERIKASKLSEQAKQGENIYSLSLKNIINNRQSHIGHCVNIATALALVFPIVT